MMMITPIDNTNQNFKGLKKINITGDFRNNSKSAKEILEVIKSDENITRFCDKYDTKINLHAYRLPLGTNIAQVSIFFKENADGSGIRNLFVKVLNFFKHEKSITCSDWGIDMPEASKELIKNLKTALNAQISNAEKTKHFITAKNSAEISKKEDFISAKDKIENFIGEMA